jgi:hypothetical protein
MRFSNSQHQYYCGVDLHARSMYLHVLDQQGQTVTPRGGRSRCFDETAFGTERFLGRNVRIVAVRSPGTGRAGLTPYGCLAPPGLRAASARTPRGTTVSRTIPVHAGASQGRSRLPDTPPRRAENVTVEGT